MSVRDVRRSLGWTIVYCLAVFLGRQTAVAESGLALFWPAAGVAALWLMRARQETVPFELTLLFAATVIVNQTDGVSLAPALLFGVANVVVGWLVRVVAAHLGEPDPAGLLLASTRGVAILALASLAAGLLSAPFGVFAGYLIAGTWSPLLVTAWVVRNTTGVFVIAGTVLAVRAARRTREPGTRWWCCLSHDQRPHATWELSGAAAASAGALLLSFGPHQTLPISFVPLAISAFVGFRFAPAVAAIHAFAAGSAAVAMVAADWGAFGAVSDPVESAMVVQGWVLIQAAVAVTLSLAVAEHRVLNRALELSRREVDRRAQLLDAVTETVSHGIVVIDAHGEVLIRNSSAARFVPGPDHQISAEDEPARYGVTHQDGTPLTLSTMPHTIALSQGTTVQTRLLVTRDTSKTYVDVRAEPLVITGDHPHTVAVVSLQDVTAHHDQVQQLESFAGVVAHDLQNPLGAVTGWAQHLHDHLAERGSLDAQATYVLDRIDRAGQSMSDLIADLLAFASTASRPLDLTTVDLDHLVTAIADDLRAASSSAPLIISHSLGTLNADALLIRQVITNLLGNAVKYTADGVRPEIRVTRTDNGGLATLTVADNGIGIPADMRTRVFDGFTRVPGAASTRPGTGLGLAICAKAVERHHGTITADAGPHGKGTTITLRIPEVPPGP